MFVRKSATTFFSADLCQRTGFFRNCAQLHHSEHQDHCCHECQISGIHKQGWAKNKKCRRWKQVLGLVLRSVFGSSVVFPERGDMNSASPSPVGKVHVGQTMQTRASTERLRAEPIRQRKKCDECWNQPISSRCSNCLTTEGPKSGSPAFLCQLCMWVSGTTHAYTWKEAWVPLYQAVHNDIRPIRTKIQHHDKRIIHVLDSRVVTAWQEQTAFNPRSGLQICVRFDTVSADW